MDILSNLSLGFSTALTPLNLAYCFAGTLLGTLVGVLPGLGPMVTIAMLLPLTFSLDAAGALIMLAGIYYGAQYGGSTTSILVNIPGETASVVTCLDGYKMARQGRAGLALATAAIASFFAGTIATAILALFAPPLAAMAIQFGPAEYTSLLMLGLMASVVLASGSIVKAIGMVIIGLLMGSVGTDVNSGAARFTLDLENLLDGVEFVAVAIGVFGVAEIIRNLEEEGEQTTITTKIQGLMPTRADLKRIFLPSLQGTGLGALLGILPGGGPALGAFTAYALAKKTSKHPEEFGKGAIEGVAAPEAANNAAAQTSFIPMLTLGIPSNGVMALMIGAMLIKGIQPGPNVMSAQPALFWGVIVSMWIGNLFCLVLNLPLVGLWAKLVSVPYHLLFPVIVGICCIGAFSINNKVFDVELMVFFSIIGVIFSKLDCEPAPLLLGFVVGPMFEENLRRALVVSRGDPMIFIERPISATLLAIVVVILLLPLLPAINKKRKDAFTE